jgi:4-hydroxy-4-methyl-2-oxoglutarate aldolase
MIKLGTIAIAFLMVTAACAEDLSEGFRLVEAASVSDAMEQLYGTKAYMSHDMRPLTQTKFAGPAVTVLLKKEEHHEGVIVLEDGLDYAAVGGLMSTALKVRGFIGAIVDGGIRDTPQITKLQFPVFSRGIVPSTTINHYRFAGKNIPVTCAGVQVRASDIIVADMDGVVVVPKEKAAEVLKRAQQLDDGEHSMLPFIEKYKSIRQAVAKFGRL